MSARDSTAVLDRLIRVRRVRARLALAALGRSRARIVAETALLDRVAGLLGEGGTGTGMIAADAAASRATTDAMLGRLSDDVGRRLAVTQDDQRQLAEVLGRARAAVDAAVARRAEREAEG